MVLYRTTTALGVCSLIAGSLAVASHLAGQMSVGSASGESLVGGGIAMVLGLLFLVLGDLGQRLVRIEQETVGSAAVSDGIGPTIPPRGLSVGEIDAAAKRC